MWHHPGEWTHAFILNSSVSARTQRVLRTLLLSWCSFLEKKGFLAENPILQIDRPKVRAVQPKILSVEQCRALLHAAANECVGRKRKRGLMLLYIALALYIGFVRKRRGAANGTGASLILRLT